MMGHLKHGSIHKAKAEQSSILLLFSNFTLHTTTFRKEISQMNLMAWNIKISSKLIFCGQIISNIHIRQRDTMIEEGVLQSKS